MTVVTTDLAVSGPRESRPPAHPRRVLIAEDEHLVAASLQHDLEHLGCEVVGPAPTGGEAVRLAQTVGCDLALVDLHLPEVHGIDVARTLFERHRIPVIVVTAHSDDAYIQASAATGVFAYLLKPIGRDHLRVTLPLAWSRYLAQVQLASEVRLGAQKLEERKLVERAKGLMMEQLHITEPEAMRRLQRDARSSRQTMTQVAKAVIDTYAAPAKG